MKAKEHRFEGQTNQEIILKMILGKEQMSLEYRYLHSLLGTIKRQSITSIAIPQTDGTTKILTTSKEIQEVKINQNIKHFIMLEASPFGLEEFFCQAKGDHRILISSTMYTMKFNSCR